ncbi:phage/plasmid replication protein, II/X family [Uliginosibacterium sp. 31-12]|uniref:phage/plasmid replication protein, II/X family n=1 Tax=Uliginosibacterium sp. 31-12 TaxID=3062781 RepID=UPI0026E353F2|nr:phage/plasmid replication protein, II/X family [Uliginosibacterium sp. 31-12]MDO6387914.1 phage/plasmid replication protein, II/X family [Uliginosibacterium sp. 31-12]
MNNSKKPKPSTRGVAKLVTSTSRNTVSSMVFHMDEQHQLEHVAQCVMVDTIILAMSHVDPKLKNSYGRLDQSDDDDNEFEFDPDSAWGKADMRNGAGKQSLRIRKGLIKKRGSTAYPEIKIEGSYAAHAQGHNVVSSADVRMLSYAMLRAVNSKYPLVVPVERKLAIAQGGDIRIERIDVTLLMQLPKGMSTGDFINAVSFALFALGLPVDVYPRETVSFDAHSQSNSMKLYDKYKENESKRKPCWSESPNADRLKQIARDYVRVEFVFRKKYFLGLAELGGELPTPAWFTKERLAQMVLKVMERLRLHQRLKSRLSPHDLNEIPRPYRSTLALWQNGDDLDMHMSKLTRAGHRKYLLENHSIDIACAPPSVFELIDLAEALSPANFVPIPDDVRTDPTLFYGEDINQTIDRFERFIASQEKVA